MVTRHCKICNKLFETRTCGVFCSISCRKKNESIRKKEFNKKYPNRIKNRIKEKFELSKTNGKNRLILCECGCGNYRWEYDERGDKRKLIFHHKKKVIINRLIKCGCGCGKKFWEFNRNYKRTYIKTHDKKGKHLSKKHKEKIGQKNSGKNNGMYKKIHTSEAIEKIRQSSVKRLPEILETFRKGRKKASKSRSITYLKKWQDEDYRLKKLKSMRQGLLKRPTTPERILINLIKKKNLPFKYVGDGKFWIRGKNFSFNPDFISTKKNYKIIEVFGDYWHNRDDMKKRDRERKKTYKEKNYQTLIIWEKELHDNLDIVEKKIISLVASKHLTPVPLQD